MHFAFFYKAFHAMLGKVLNSLYVFRMGRKHFFFSIFLVALSPGPATSVLLGCDWFNIILRITYCILYYATDYKYFSDMKKKIKSSYITAIKKPIT